MEPDQLCRENLVRIKKGGRLRDPCICSAGVESLFVTTTAAAIAAAESTATAATGLTLTRFTDRDPATVHLLAVEFGNRRLGIIHLDKAEPAGSSRFAIRDDFDRLHLSTSGEALLQLLFSSTEGEITYIQLTGHKKPP